MAKRKRLTISEIGADGYCVVEFYGRQYAWYIEDHDEYENLTDEKFYTCEIIHNSYGQAMIDFTSNKTNESVYRQEVNPVEHKGSDEWVVDK
jgi:hypothetical protein